MSLTNAEIAAIPTYTDAEHLKLVDLAITTVLASGTAVGINGRSVTRSDLPELYEAKAIIEARINAASSGDGIALITFDEAS